MSESISIPYHTPETSSTKTTVDDNKSISCLERIKQLYDHYITNPLCVYKMCPDPTGEWIVIMRKTIGLTGDDMENKKDDDLTGIYKSVYKYCEEIKKIRESIIEWIPYSQITNTKEIAKGGFGIIYKATWIGKDVAVKKFFNSQNMSKYFLSEVIIFIFLHFILIFTELIKYFIF